MISRHTSELLAFRALMMALLRRSVTQETDPQGALEDLRMGTLVQLWESTSKEQFVDGDIEAAESYHRYAEASVEAMFKEVGTHLKSVQQEA